MRSGTTPPGRPVRRAPFDLKRFGRGLLLVCLVGVLFTPAQAAHGDTRYVPRFERVARGLLGTPYVYGGSSPAYGLDCSGFVRYVVGVDTGRWLPHNAAAMASVVANSPDGIKPGDLLFFDYYGTGIDHVELALGGGLMIGTSNVYEDADIDAVDWYALVKVGRIPALTADVRAHETPEHKIQRWTNERRAKHGLTGLTKTPRLGTTANTHSQKMADNSSLFHGDYVYGKCWGQNVGVGPSVWSVFIAWMKSPDHRKNILEPCFEHTGVGVVRSGGAVWVTQDFTGRHKA